MVFLPIDTLKFLNIKYPNTPDCLSTLKKQGYQLVATSLRPDSIPLSELDITQPTALCFGTEETGLSDEVHEQADQQVYLPMYGFTQSFNISVSAALALSCLVEKLHQSSIAWQLDEAQRLELELAWLVKSASNGEALLRRFNQQK